MNVFWHKREGENKIEREREKERKRKRKRETMVVVLNYLEEKYFVGRNISYHMYT